MKISEEMNHQECVTRMADKSLRFNGFKLFWQLSSDSLPTPRLAEPFLSSGRIFLLIKNLLSSNARPSVVCFAAIAWKEMFHSRSLARAVSLDPQFLL
jgi:hypothetical protein